uniref:Uncharacterized protein n=1 Tax=Setaria digitata TaxID=48799 RepID=A0A915PUI3_9BILA
MDEGGGKVLLAYPASACLGGSGGCCSPQSQQPCAGPVCSGSQLNRPGYSVPQTLVGGGGGGGGGYPGSVDLRTGSYVAPVLNAPGTYNVVPAAGPAPYNSAVYDGQQLKSPAQQTYGGGLHGVASQQQYKDVSLVDTPSVPLSVGSQISGRFPDITDGALDLASVAQAPPSSVVQAGDGAAQEVDQRSFSTPQPQSVLAQQRNVLRRQRLFN